MSYIPNRLVNANLITGNNELVEENNLVPYEGAYHQLYNGSAYTGPNQYSPNRRRLIPNPNGSLYLSLIYSLVENIAGNTDLMELEPPIFGW